MSANALRYQLTALLLVRTNISQDVKKTETRSAGINDPHRLGFSIKDLQRHKYQNFTYTVFRERA
jgi:hypothetical protein